MKTTFCKLELSAIEHQFNTTLIDSLRCIKFLLCTLIAFLCDTVDIYELQTHQHPCTVHLNSSIHMFDCRLHLDNTNVHQHCFLVAKANFTTRVNAVSHTRSFVISVVTHIELQLFAFLAIRIAIRISLQLLNIY